MHIKTNAVKAFTAASDQRAKEGYFVDADGVVMASATVAPFGVILDGGNEDQVTSVAVGRGGFMGTVSVKVKASSPGTINAGTLLVLVNDGTVKAYTGTPGEVIVAQAMEAGAADELIEAVLIRPVIVGPDTIDDDSVTAGKLADDAVEAAKIAAGAVTAPKLADAVADQIFSTTVVVANTGTPDGVANITGQVQDAQGNSLAGYFLIELWLATSGAMAAPADLGTLTAKTNSVLVKEHTDDALALIRTHSDGSWGAELDTASDGTVHAMAVVTGKVVTANAAITGN